VTVFVALEGSQTVTIILQKNLIFSISGGRWGVPSSPLIEMLQKILSAAD
jgi:hypothetical protein